MAKRFNWLGVESADYDVSPDLEDVSYDPNWTVDGRTLKVLADLKASRSECNDTVGKYEYTLLQGINSIDNPMDRLVVLIALSISVYPAVANTVASIMEQLPAEAAELSSQLSSGYFSGNGQYSNLNNYYARTQCLATDSYYELPRDLLETVLLTNKSAKQYTTVSDILDTLGGTDAKGFRPKQYATMDLLIAYKTILTGSINLDTPPAKVEPDNPYAAKIRQLTESLDKEEALSVDLKLGELLDNYQAPTTVGNESLVEPEPPVLNPEFVERYNAIMLLLRANSWDTAFDAIEALVSNVTPDTDKHEVLVLATLIETVDMKGIWALHSQLLLNYTDGLVQYGLVEALNYSESKIYRLQSLDTVFGLAKYKSQRIAIVRDSVVEFIRTNPTVQQVTKYRTRINEELHTPYAVISLEEKLLSVYMCYIQHPHHPETATTKLYEIIQCLSGTELIGLQGAIRYAFNDVLLPDGFKIAVGIESLPAKVASEQFTEWFSKVVWYVGVEAREEDSEKKDYQDIPELPETVNAGAVTEDDAADASGALYKEARNVTGPTVELNPTAANISDYVANDKGFELVNDLNKDADNESDVTVTAVDNIADDNDESIIEDDDSQLDNNPDNDLPPITPETKAVEEQTPEDLLDNTLDKFMDDYNSAESELSEGEDSTDDLDTETDSLDSDESDSEGAVEDEGQGTEDDEVSEDVGESEDSTEEIEGDEGIVEDDDESSEDDNIDIDDGEFSEDEDESDGTTEGEEPYTEMSETTNSDVELDRSATDANETLIKLKAIEALKQIATENNVSSPVATKLLKGEVSNILRIEFPEDMSIDELMATTQVILDEQITDSHEDLYLKMEQLLNNTMSLSDTLYKQIAVRYNYAKREAATVFSTISTPTTALLLQTSTPDDYIIEATLEAKHSNAELIRCIGETISNNTYSFGSLLCVPDTGMIYYTQPNGDSSDLTLTGEDLRKLCIVAGYNIKRLANLDVASILGHLELLIRDYTRTVGDTTKIADEIVRYAFAVRTFVSVRLSFIMATYKLPTISFKEKQNG